MNYHGHHHHYYQQQQQQQHPAVLSAGQNDYSFSSSQQNILLSIVGGSIFVLWMVFPSVGIIPSVATSALWNMVVYITPSPLVAALDAKEKDSSNTNTSTGFTDLNEKSQAMKRILGRGRSLSTGLLGGGRDTIPPGLGNWDNSCYQNSVIQGLSSLKSFVGFLDHNTRDLQERGSLKTHKALKEITQALNDPANHGQMFWIPAELKSMSSWQQQDAQEYFSKIMDQLDKETRDALRGVTTNTGLRFNTFTNQVAEGFNSSRQSPTSDETRQHYASYANPLEGMLAQRVGCMRCGWTEGLSLIPFNCLTVSIGRKLEYDIRECLDDYMSLEAIEGVECARCTLLRTKDQLHRLIEQNETDTPADGSASQTDISKTLRESAKKRLETVQEALDEQEFTDKVLSNKCHIPSKNRVSATKSRQAVIARAPKSLVFHINRSVFNEVTGTLMKNHAHVRFPESLDLNEWCLGTKRSENDDQWSEIWNTDPNISMLPQPGAVKGRGGLKYELRAVLTHYGRHENGHYICYRKFSTEDFPVPVSEHTSGPMSEECDEKRALYRWFRLSDEDVQAVGENVVFSQGGVFMLFYERIDETNAESQHLEKHSDEIAAGVRSVDNLLAASVNKRLDMASASIVSVASSEVSVDEKLEVASSDESGEESRPISSSDMSAPSGMSDAESDVCKSDAHVQTPATAATKSFSQSPVTA